jgi:UDPglucose 6-dehydrogenase
MSVVAVFGCGYVGLVTGVCLSKIGHAVRCYDTDLTKIRLLQQNKPPFYEPGLQPLLERLHKRGSLQFTSNVRTALEGAGVVFIAVGTPSGPTGEADLTYVRQAAHEIAANATGNLIVVNKSTVPVETADLVERIIARERRSAEITVASNPEFLREGSAVGDFMHPDRIVIGCSNAGAARALSELYAPLGAPVQIVDVRTAEMIKYAANAFLAMKISFINEIANLCSAVNADIDGVVAGIGSDERIGRSYLKPGLGFGGSCLPKDVAALATLARAKAVEPTMLEAALNVNRRQVGNAVKCIEGAIGDVIDKPIAVAGLAFKGGTDDLRESPSMVLIEALLTRGAKIRVYDTRAMQAAKRVLRERVRYARSLYDAGAGASAFVIANDDPAFSSIDWGRIAQRMPDGAVVDLRNRADARKVRESGLYYCGVGRPANETARIAK